MSVSGKLMSFLIPKSSGRLGMSLRLCSSNSSYPAYPSLSVSQPSQHVVQVELNRPKKMNALNKELWMDIGDVFRKIDKDPECRVVILAGIGKMFSSGIDLTDLSDLASIVYGEEDAARKSMKMFDHLTAYQEQFTDLERCRKPVIACVHNACVGGGVDLITAADIRLATEDAWFCVKEVDMGLAADVGTLQRLPKVIGSQSLVSELCLTGRRLPAPEALSCGLLSGPLQPHREALLAAAQAMAADMAAKSPVAVQGTKVNLVYSRDHTTAEGLLHVGRWNMAMLQSEDVMKSAMAAMDKDNKEPPQFENF